MIDTLIQFKPEVMFHTVILYRNGRYSAIVIITSILICKVFIKNKARGSILKKCSRKVPEALSILYR
jgi:hypothetical protein